MAALNIFDIYRTNFQLEFVFKYAKQFTGLAHRLTRNKEDLSFAFNASLSSANVAKAFVSQQGIDTAIGALPAKTLLHNAAMMDRFTAMS